MIKDRSSLFFVIKDIVLQSRQRVLRITNSVLLDAYWEIGINS